MSSSSSSWRSSRQARHHQFPVGSARWRHVAVVDAGCGCRPRRATSRLLSQLPSFLRPSPAKPPQPQHPARSSSRSSSGFFPSSASTASSASAATFTTTHSSHSHSHSYSYVHPPTATATATTKHPPDAAAAAARRRRRRRPQSASSEKLLGHGGGRREEGGVGVAVEKESSDPRADFRDSMAQMVLEAGLCGWDDLRAMLRRLLALNAPRHHAAILAAFAEVCAQLAAPPPPPPPQPQPQPAYHHYHAYDDDYHYHY